MPQDNIWIGNKTRPLAQSGRLDQNDGPLDDWLDVTASSDLTGTVNGTSTTTGTVVGREGSFGVVNGASTTTGTVVGREGAFGTVTGTATSTGTVVGREGATGTVNGTSTTSGSVVGSGGNDAAPLTISFDPPARKKPHTPRRRARGKAGGYCITSGAAIGVGAAADSDEELELLELI